MQALLFVSGVWVYILRGGLILRSEIGFLMLKDAPFSKLAKPVNLLEVK